MINVKKYRKKPVVIQAYEITQELLANVECSPIGQVYFYADRVEVETLEGRMRGEIGSFVITGVEGEQYVCERNIFFKTYESVDADTSDWDLKENLETINKLKEHSQITGPAAELVIKDELKKKNTSCCSTQSMEDRGWKEVQPGVWTKNTKVTPLKTSDKVEECACATPKTRT